MLALRGSNGVGFRVGLLILRQRVDGRADHQTLCICSQSRCHARLVQAKWSLFFKYVDFYNRKTTFSSQIATWPALALGSRISLLENRISLLENRISLLDAYTKILK